MSQSSSPPDAERDLKKQILRQAVEDNLSERAGTRPARTPSAPRLTPERQRPSWRPVMLSAAAVVSTVALVSAGLPLLRPAKTEPVPEFSAAVSRPASEPVVVTPLFEAPKPIDFDVFPLAVRRILIDPGHGGEDTGTTGGGLTEKAMTLDIALRLREQLQAQGFEVFMTREQDRAISLRQRALQANQLRADLFISIHINWIAERSVRGLETYYLGATDDPELNALARRENSDSGYSLSDMKRLLEGLYTGVRQDESHQLASRVQRSLYRSLLRQNPNLKDRGVKTAPFVVLVATEMPAILAEVSCLSNEQEAKLLARPLYRQHIAEALSRGIRSYADEVNQSEAKGADG